MILRIIAIVTTALNILALILNGMDIIRKDNIKERVRSIVGLIFNCIQLYFFYHYFI